MIDEEASVKSKKPSSTPAASTVSAVPKTQAKLKSAKSPQVADGVSVR